MTVAALTLGLSSAAVAKKGGKPKPQPKAEAKKEEDAGASGSDQAAFLVKPAEEALKARKFGLAISLYRGIVAIRGDGDDAVWKLAEAWQLAGEFDEAAEELQRYVAAQTDEDKVSKARNEINSLAGRTAGFGKMFEPVAAETQAKEAFKRGRKLFDQKKYAEAAALFKAGSEMAPDIPGNYRELGEALTKLNKKQEAIDFFVRYLRLRPFGKNADEVRKRLEKEGVVGKLTIESALPCEQVWMDRQPFPADKKLPAKDIVVAPGRHRLLCYSEKYHMAHYISATVKAKESVTATFSWAILENALDPWGRIVLEDGDDPDTFHDIGLWKEIGLPVPVDRRALRAKLKSADGSKTKEITVKLEAGKRVKVEW
jgi:tetratricopeptide (TPR) repeat protein